MCASAVAAQPRPSSVVMSCAQAALQTGNRVGLLAAVPPRQTLAPKIAEHFAHPEFKVFRSGERPQMADVTMIEAGVWQWLASDKDPLASNSPRD